MYPPKGKNLALFGVLVQKRRPRLQPNTSLLNSPPNSKRRKFSLVTRLNSSARSSVNRNRKSSGIRQVFSQHSFGCFFVLHIESGHCTHIRPPCIIHKMSIAGVVEIIVFIFVFFLVHFIFPKAHFSSHLAARSWHCKNEFEPVKQSSLPLVCVCIGVARRFTSSGH